MGLSRLSWVLCSCALLSCVEDRASDWAAVASGRALRPTPGSDELPPTFDRGDKVEQFASPGGFFRVHYARAGRHAVPVPDTNSSGVPDFVETVARQYDEVLGFFAQLGYREPKRDDDVAGDNGGDGRFDVYLLDFPTSADGTYRAEMCAADGCTGYMVLENDFTGRNYRSREDASKLVSSHEFFHAIQHAYLPGSVDVLAEGTAVWASEAFDAATGDLEKQAAGYLARPERPLSQKGTTAVDPFAYGTSLFFQHLDETVGRDVIRELWERAADSGGTAENWPDLLDELLREKHDSSLAAVFARFVEWNLFTGARADPERSYARGNSYPLVTERMLMEAFDDADIRVFPISARYYALRAGVASQLMAAADVPSGAASPGLELLVAMERRGVIGEVKHARNAALLQAELALEAGDTFHVVLLNTLSSGESLRPGLCIGTPSEVASCRGTREPDAGMDEEEPSSESGDGGCSVSRPGSGGELGLWGLMLLLICRRQRRTSPAGPPLPS